VDNFKGAYDATEHLIQCGYRHIATLAGSPHLYISKERLNGYQKALEDRGIPFDPGFTKFCLHGGMMYEEVEQALDELMQLPQRPDAILATGDKITTNCLRYFKTKKIKVPDEMALIGFSNLDLTDLLSPSLSVVRQPAFEMGQIATELLLQLIESKRRITEFETRKLPLQLLVRESSIKKNEATIE